MFENWTKYVNDTLAMLDNKRALNRAFEHTDKYVNDTLADNTAAGDQIKTKTGKEKSQG